MAKAPDNVRISPRTLQNLERLETIATWLAKPGAVASEVAAMVIQTYSGDKPMTPARANRLVREAREFLQMGGKENREAAASKYNARLEWLLRQVTGHLVTDEVERTSIGPEPQQGANGQAVAPGGRMLKVKLKSRVLNVSAAALALKIMKEIAALNGARPVGGPTKFEFNQTNNVNLPGARATARMTGDELARYLTGALTPPPELIDGELAEPNPASPPADPGPPPQPGQAEGAAGAGGG